MSKKNRKTAAKVTDKQLYRAAIAFNEADELIARISAAKEAKCKEYDAMINESLNVLNSAFEIIEKYAHENKHLFAKHKSVDTGFVRFGYRTGLPTVTLQEGHTWDASAKILKAFYPECAKATVTLNKEKILKNRGNKAFINFLSGVGIEIKQGESFYVESK